MPGGKNKRNKVIHLTQVQRKGRSLKTKIIEKTRGYIKKFKFCYIFEH